MKTRSDHQLPPLDPAITARERGQFVRGASNKNLNPKQPGGPQQTRAPPDGAYDAFIILEFCRRHRISVSFFHKLRSQGRGPAVMRVGARTLISCEAARAWRVQMQEDQSA
jgi:hypothetical protein